jgi:hypothetical protein
MPNTFVAAERSIENKFKRGKPGSREATTDISPAFQGWETNADDFVPVVTHFTSRIAPSHG